MGAPHNLLPALPNARKDRLLLFSGRKALQTHTALLLISGVSLSPALSNFAVKPGCNAFNPELDLGRKPSGLSSNFALATSHPSHLSLELIPAWNISCCFLLLCFPQGEGKAEGGRAGTRSPIIKYSNHRRLI